MVSMSSFKSIGITLLGALTLSGCASTGTDYVLREPFSFETVCVVDNKNVPAKFFITLKQAIVDKGLKVRTVSKPDKDCKATLYYEAKYGVLIPNLLEAKLTLTTPQGPADIVELSRQLETAPLYEKAKDAAPEIREMVNRLLPRGTPW